MLDFWGSLSSILSYLKQFDNTYKLQDFYNVLSDNYLKTKEPFLYFPYLEMTYILKTLNEEFKIPSEHQSFLINKIDNKIISILKTNFDQNTLDNKMSNFVGSTVTSYNYDGLKKDFIKFGLNNSFDKYKSKKLNHLSDLDDFNSSPLVLKSVEDFVKQLNLRFPDDFLYLREVLLVIKNKYS